MWPGLLDRGQLGHESALAEPVAPNSWHLGYAGCVISSDCLQTSKPVSFGVSPKLFQGGCVGSFGLVGVGPLTLWWSTIRSLARAFAPCRPQALLRLLLVIVSLW